jgi:hypothetical protein
VKVGIKTLYTAGEVRRLLFKRERVSRQGARKLYSPILAGWARGLAKQDEQVGVQVLDSLLRAAIPIPEPAKSQYIVEVWAHFDAINSLLRSARAGEDISFAGKKVPEPQIFSFADAIDFVKKRRPA